MKYLVFILTVFLVSCSKPKPPTTSIVVIEELKILDKGDYYPPDLYIITKDRESILMTYNELDFTRLKVGDSIRVTEEYGIIRKIEILNLDR